MFPKEKITPSLQASDDLSLSNLIVGQKYAYCVRAISQALYMDHPYDSYESFRSTSSSGSACTSQTIRWESSFHGKVTTEPNAGNLPIEEVAVTWYLLDTDHKPLDCIGCSGTDVTGESGNFKIEFNVHHEYLKGRNDDDIPVRLFFSKTTSGTPDDITHKFLCEDGTIEFDATQGYIVYISHLDFKEPLHIYDDTSVPFEGKVFIDDTVYDGSEGCAISGVDICLYHNSTTGSEEELVCVATDPSGQYVAPVVIGSRVDSVKLAYNDHTFVKSSENDGPYPEVGLNIDADGVYTGNDYVDITKADVTVNGKVFSSNSQRVLKSTRLDSFKSIVTTPQIAKKI